MGRDPETGKKKYEGHTIHGTKADAQAYLDGELKERDFGRKGGAEAMTGADKRWIETLLSTRLRGVEDRLMEFLRDMQTELLSQTGRSRKAEPPVVVKQLLTLHEVAEILDVTYQRAAEMARDQLLPAVRLGRQVRVNNKQLQEFIERNGKPLGARWGKKAK
jgi:excisionase family DNA binding protein